MFYCDNPGFLIFSCMKDNIRKNIVLRRQFQLRFRNLRKRSFNRYAVYLCTIHIFFRRCHVLATRQYLRRKKIVSLQTCEQYTTAILHLLSSQIGSQIKMKFTIFLHKISTYSTNWCNFFIMTLHFTSQKRAKSMKLTS